MYKYSYNIFDFIDLDLPVRYLISIFFFFSIIDYVKQLIIFVLTSIIEPKNLISSNFYQIHIFYYKLYNIELKFVN